jgi:hypothetical protein
MHCITTSRDNFFLGLEPCSRRFDRIDPCKEVTPGSYTCPTRCSKSPSDSSGTGPSEFEISRQARGWPRKFTQLSSAVLQGNRPRHASPIFACFACLSRSEARLQDSVFLGNPAKCEREKGRGSQRRTRIGSWCSWRSLGGPWPTLAEWMPSTYQMRRVLHVCFHVNTRDASKGSRKM